MSAEAAVVAVYGGSFDPPHVGHLLAASYVAAVTDVSTVLFVPAAEHAFGKNFRATLDQRVAMLDALAVDVPRAEVSDIERTIDHPGRTLSMLEALRRARPDASFRLVVGADIAAETSRWHRWDDIVRIAAPLWVGREGYPRPPGVEVDMPAISSTEIRRRLAAGESVHGLVPRGVRDVITALGLYGEA